MRFRASVRWSGLTLLTFGAASLLYGIELKPETLLAFNAYVTAAEARMDRELRPGSAFLWIDGFADSRRQRLEADVRNGNIDIRQQRPEHGNPKAAPDGMIHDWVGVIFVPGVQLARVLEVLQDYDHHSIIFKPSVRRSKLVEHQGNRYQIELQLYKESPVRVAFNAEFDVGYTRIDATRAESRAMSTRIAELKDPVNIDSPELPVGTGRGYVWRMNNYWRLQEKDGGVYIQVESIALSRSVPALLSWFINPIIRRAARETIADSLIAVRKAVLQTPVLEPTADARVNGFNRPSGAEKMILFQRTPGLRSAPNSPPSLRDSRRRAGLGGG